MNHKIFESMKLLFLLLVVGFMWSGCSGTDPVVTTGSISGKVTDSRSGEPLQGVTVSLTPSELKSRTTGSDGYFEFTDLQPGSYTLQGVKENYRTNTKEGRVVAAMNTPCDFTLTPSASRLEVSQLSVDFGKY